MSTNSDTVLELQIEMHNLQSLVVLDVQKLRTLENYIV